MDFAEACNQLLTVCDIQAVFGRLAHGNDEHIAIAVESEIRLIDDGVRHLVVTMQSVFR